MDIDLLRALNAARLPLRLADPGQRDAARLLDATGCITALIPPTQIECDDRPRQHDVIVVEITPIGRAALAREKQGNCEQGAPVPHPGRQSTVNSLTTRTLAWWRSGWLVGPRH